MKYNKLTRRHFLMGTGSSFLALPFLPSLMRKAHADSLPTEKCMVVFVSGHGGVNQMNMYPISNNPAIASQLTTTPIYPAVSHNVYSGRLLNLKTTMASNIPYVPNSQGFSFWDQSGDVQGMAGYSVDRSGRDFDNGAARVTPIIGSFVSDALLNKMNLVAGLDMMGDTGHNIVQSGNFFLPSNGNPNFAKVSIPTIDWVVANFPSFYGASLPVAPSVMLNTIYGSCEDLEPDVFSTYRNRAGATVGNPNSVNSVGQAFSLLFGSLQSSLDPATLGKKNFVLNNVYQDYSRVARGAYGPGRRIGKDDRNRLEEFMSSVNAILHGVISGSGAVCSIPNISGSDQGNVLAGTFAGAPVDLTALKNTMNLYNQIITASFACGLSKIFMVGVPAYRDEYFPQGSPSPTFPVSYGGDTHQDVFHRHSLPDRQNMLVEHKRFFFQNCFYDLMQKLDNVSGNSGTLLDQSLLFWTNEFGHNTHMNQGLPMIMAGGAGGFFKTGQYVDYRNTARHLGANNYGGDIAFQGLPYNRFLATVLQSMGLSPADFELPANTFAGSSGRIPITSRGTTAGYGHTYQDMFQLNRTNGIYPYDYALNDMSVPLPILT